MCNPHVPILPCGTLRTYGRRTSKKERTIEHVDTLVIGGGAMGSATAWALARAGREVVLAERFTPGHANGASHGEFRNFNVAYTEPDYVAMLVEARRLWGELEDESGEKLLDLVGLVNHGEGPDARFDAAHAQLEGAGIASEFLAPEAAHDRWPGMRFDTRVLFSPESGRVRADDSVVALQRAAQGHGADIRHETRAVAIRLLADDLAEVELERDGVVETIRARSVVVTAGAWTEKLLGELIPLPRLIVTQEQPAHFAVSDPALVSTWPSFNHLRDRAHDDYWYSDVYGMLTPSEGVKVGWHGTGLEIDPDARTFDSEPVQLAALRRYAAEWLPGVDPDAFVEISCTYTSTDTTDFVLDRVGPVTIGAGFSGHGFKFTPTVGRILADIAMGRSRPAARFSLGS
ncbi:FAD-dependent oxidoreductase [Frondihabitans sp. 4ASC-45]|uniref:FAD-dependent oxidoreductase n=1 Tax=Frondihabitans sp. 4ASC-45 TaxID=3111636 RepID=UPI003C14EACC